MADKSVVPEGMVPWAGGRKPQDWSGEAVQFRDGMIMRSEPGTIWKLGWDHSYGNGDVIAYTPASNPLSLETSDLDPITPVEDALATKAIVAMGWTRQSYDSAVRMVRVVVAEINAEARIADAERAMWQAIQNNGPPNRALDWVIGSLGHLSDGLHDAKSPWADYAKRLYQNTSNDVAAFRMKQLQAATHSIQSGGEGGEG